jgi:energy-coupling factor transporter ATP-binding protein EcfA2
MGIVRMVAEGIGPFEDLDLDFSDGKGNPHLGPHILAGVNGSGKSTILKAIAWVLAEERSGFPIDEFRHLLREGKMSRVQLDIPALGDSLVRIFTGHLRGQPELPTPLGIPIQVFDHLGNLFTSGGRHYQPGGILAVAYAPGKEVGFIPSPEIGRIPPVYLENSLGFGSTISNEVIQSWLLGLRLRLLTARDQKQPTEPYQHALDGLEAALEMLCLKKVGLEVDTTKSQVQPCLRIDGKMLNFSQIPAGIRHTFGWVADFKMRMDQIPAGTKPATILLLDEIDGHLHPQWQRKLLPAMRKAFPETQIIVSSHSPFVISSCPEAVIHVLDADVEGKARLVRSVKAPVGTDILTTLEDIFGVESRFDVQTEADLKEWNTLKRGEAAGKLSTSERKSLAALTQELMTRSEELRIILGSRPFPAELAEQILSKKNNGRPQSRKTAVSGRRPGR